jgi:transposase
VSSSRFCLVPGSLSVEQILPTPDHVTILARARSEHAACPGCGTISRRVHSHRARMLRDLPWQGRPVSLQLRSRRFRCTLEGCSRRTFTERLGDVARLHARRTERVSTLHRCIGLAVSGEAGARLAERLAMPVSPDTLLRAACQASRGATPSVIPRVLGVDDWAWRRGHRYGTILVDLERNEVVDLLPDRKAETLAAWLRDRPEVEIVVRDRASVYAEGARNGAPDAIQVADRWHMLRNLGDAVHKAVERHHAAVRQVASDMRDMSPAALPDVAAVKSVVPTPKPGTPSPSRREANFAEAMRLSRAGASISRISRLLEVDRKTLRRWISTGELPSWQQPNRGRATDVHLPYLEQRLAEGCHNASLLWRELKVLGFRGRYTAVKTWVGEQRPAETRARLQREDGSIWSPPSTRRIACLMMTDAARTDTQDASFVAGLLSKAPTLADTVSTARRLALLLRHKSQETLATVLEAAGRTLLRPFVATLRRDIAAVQAALELPWTTSPVEGQISRLKMIKRTMYGRAGFPLLRARVLNAE